mmetsp:Transcript_29742/g.64346  ORF Transcript_29742/g.64346 Transcript_29742/m.64346 type:complete len:219 (+) Transcript_29742:290-946(+)
MASVLCRLPSGKGMPQSSTSRNPLGKWPNIGQCALSSSSVRGLSWQVRYSGCSSNSSARWVSFATRPSCKETPNKEKPCSGAAMVSQQRPASSLEPLRSSATWAMSHIRELAQNMQESPAQSSLRASGDSNQPSSSGSSKLEAGIARTFCRYSATGFDHFVPDRGSKARVHIKKLAFREKSCSLCCVAKSALSGTAWTLLSTSELQKEVCGQKWELYL